MLCLSSSSLVIHRVQAKETLEHTKRRHERRNCRIPLFVRLIVLSRLSHSIPTTNLKSRLIFIGLRSLSNGRIGRNGESNGYKCMATPIQGGTKRASASMSLMRQEERASYGRFWPCSEDHYRIILRKTISELCRKTISESVSSKLKDRLCVTLDAELKEMHERMKDQQKYEVSGRAYVLSGLSSHSWQRATGRGDFTESASLTYQTSSMVDMVQRSQTINRTVSKMRHAKSFPV